MGRGEAADKADGATGGGSVNSYRKGEKKRGHKPFLRFFFFGGRPMGLSELSIPKRLATAIAHASCP